MNELSEYIKKAFEYKTDGLYKESIDYFYKALAIDNDSSEIMYELAYLYSKLHKYDRAASFYEQVLLKNSNDYKARYSFAMMYKKIHEYANAEKQLLILFNADFDLIHVAEVLFSVLFEQRKAKRIIELYNSKCNYLKSSLVYYYVAQAYSELNKQNIADEFYKKSFEVDNNNIESGANVAYILFDKGLYAESENLLLTLLKHSENDKIFFLLGEIYYLKSDFDLAIKYYSLALKRNDKKADYFFKLGTVYSLKGFLIEAEENYQKAIALEPENLLYNYTLAYLYYINDKKSLALRIVDYLISLDNKYLPALSLKLLLMINNNNISDASKVLEEIEQFKNKDEFSYYAISVYYSKLNRWNKSIQNILKAMSYNTESCEYNYELANCYYNLKEYAKSEEICNHIILKNDKYLNAYLLLAKINYEKKDFEKANINIDKALKLDMNIPVVYEIKGKILKENNDFDGALKNFRIALSISPDCIEYYELTANCYFAKGDYNKAYLYYKEASDIDISNAEYKYYMAKCAQANEDIENAIVNYSIAKRLAPQNITYLMDYADLLYTKYNKKSAVKLVKSSLKFFESDEKNKLKQLINGYK